MNAPHGLDKVKVFRALGDETRLAMVRNLRDAGGEMPCSSLVQACRTTRTAASYHYKELEQAGLITRRREAGRPRGNWGPSSSRTETIWSCRDRIGPWTNGYRCDTGAVP